MVAQKDQIRQRMGDQVRFTKELAAEVMTLPKYVFKWSKQMTKSAGNINWYNGYAVIKLSAKIFYKAVEDHDIDYACEEIHETLLHEFGHLVVDHPEHSPDWAEVVENFGGKPQQYHTMTAGKQLVPAELGSKFSRGTKVSFDAKGSHYVGRIKKQNPKNARVVVTLPRDKAGMQWNIPWSVANRTMEVVR